MAYKECTGEGASNFRGAQWCLHLGNARRLLPFRVTQGLWCGLATSSLGRRLDATVFIADDVGDIASVHIPKHGAV